MKLKKLASFIAAVAMVCSLATICSVSAQAESKEIHVKTYAELKAAVNDGGDRTSDRIIILDNDIVNTEGLRFAMPTGREITITSANPASPASILGGDYYLCASGFDSSEWQGKVNLKNINLKANWGFWVYSGANISLENVRITCTMPIETSKDPYSTYAAFGVDYTTTHSNNIPSTITMRNTVIDPSSIGSPNNGMCIYSNAKLTMMDSTILPGNNTNAELGYYSAGEGLYLNNENAEVTLTNTTITGGGSTVKESASGAGVNVIEGKLTLNNSTIMGGKDLHYGDVALYNHNGIITINGGELSAGEDPYNWEQPRLIRKLNNDSAGTITVNPMLTFVNDTTVKMSPAIIGATVVFGDGATAIVNKEGIAVRENGVSKIGEKAVLKAETITMLDSFPIIIPAIESTQLNESSVAVNAKATIPSPTYTIVIPTVIDFGEQTQALSKYADKTLDQYGKPVVVSKSFTVKAENVDNLFDDLGKAPRIDVAINFDGNMTGKDNQMSKIPYKVKKGEAAYISGTTFTSFKNHSDLAQGETNIAEGAISINRTDIKNSDSYKGTMTFMISIPAN